MKTYVDIEEIKMKFFLCFCPRTQQIWEDKGCYLIYLYNY